MTASLAEVVESYESTDTDESLFMIEQVGTVYLYSISQQKGQQTTFCQ